MARPLGTDLDWSAADADLDRVEALWADEPAAQASPAPAAWTPGFTHLATGDGGIACNNRAPIPAGKITGDPRQVSCSVCRSTRKFKAASDG